MNILFLSNRFRTPWSGPYYSIPAQVKSQAQLDDVLWINENRKVCDEWQKEIYFKNLNNISNDRLNALPEPFNKPDIVIVEEVYAHHFSHIISDIQKEKIPYIIIPRSQLTKQGQKRKSLKKWLGNLIYYKKLVYKAAAIQYLTEQELIDSGEKWNKEYFILPNGINFPNIEDKKFSKETINIVYIGRLEKYQKGLDLLLQACNNIKQQIINSKVNINLYGENRDNTTEYLFKLIKEYHLENIIFIHPAIFGEEKIKVLRKTDVFIMTSRFEGHPMGLIEALSYGLPCLVTTGTNMREEIEKFGAGWTANTTVESISEALKKIIIEKTLLEQKSINARKLAYQYNWDTIAQKSHEIYKKIIENNK